MSAMCPIHGMHDPTGCPQCEVNRQTSPSPARPSDRTTAQAFNEALAQFKKSFQGSYNSHVLTVLMLTQKRAVELDTTPEARAGDCELADDLTMYAQQIREAARGEGDPPNPWHLDDWLTRYRTRLTTKATP